MFTKAINSKKIIMALTLTILPFVTSVMPFAPRAVCHANIADGRLQGTASFVFEKGSIYDVSCQAGYITAIGLSPSEEILYVGCGDTARWILDTARSGKDGKMYWQILVKPLRNELATNLLINTNKRSYQINLLASDSQYNPYVEWVYANEEKLSIGNNTQQFAKEESVSSTKASDLNFAYKIKGKASWKPLQAFDDGRKTFLLMPERIKTSEAPVLYVLRNNQPSVINYRIKERYYIIDRLVKEIELRVGNETIRILNKSTAADENHE